MVPPGAAGWRGRLAAVRSDGRALWVVALTGTLVLVAVMMGGTVKAWFEQRSEIAALHDQVTSQRAEVKTLQEEQARWSDKAYVEQQARQRLKFVRPGETSYTVIDPHTETPRQVEGMASASVSDDVPWYGKLWSSIGAADAPASVSR